MATTRQGFIIVEGKSQHVCPVQFCRRGPHRPGDLCSQHKMRAWRAANPLKAAFAHVRQRAGRDGIGFDLTLEQFADFCARTDYLARKGREGTCLQVDRIEGRLGYSADNIQVLTCSENSAKGSRERWLRHRLPAFSA